MKLDHIALFGLVSLESSRYEALVLLGLAHKPKDLLAKWKKEWRLSAASCL